MPGEGAATSKRRQMLLLVLRWRGLGGWPLCLRPAPHLFLLMLSLLMLRLLLLVLLTLTVC